MKPLALLTLATVVTLAACELMEDWRGRKASERDELALSLEAPGVLDWGQAGVVRLSLGNQGDSAVSGVRVELYIPDWMDFGRVEPAGTEVTMVSGTGEGTRLSYRIADPPLQPGETRTVIQRVSVPAAPAGEGEGDDTTRPAPPPPAGRILRARLVRENGEVLGAEVISEIPFRGAEPLSPEETAPVGEVSIGRDRVGPLRLGMSESELRAAVSGARDTSWSAEGMTERGLVVPLGGGKSATALLVDGRVERVYVRQPEVTTGRGLGVRSTLGELRDAYGRACMGVGEGRVVVWFPAEPGVSFGLDAELPAAAASPGDLPGSAAVTEVWVRGGTSTCPAAG